ncbi:MAG: amylo-alpha-1,6-glucosidase [Chromatiaceae bacterium]|jgi:4-alpha-glucanotransferase|nr:amylo-alpha-1,6-glucosidase [Chromatiaceae bacterium]
MDQTLPQLIHFGREVCNDLDAAERREWWLTNGLGAYAAGTVAGTLTRRYHGLLIAPLAPPLGRTLVFAKAEATLVRGAERIPLATNRWVGGAVDPRGYRHLESFHLDGRLPVWRYAIGDLRLEARVWLEPRANTSYLAWRLLAGPTGGEPPRLRVRLLVNARDHHGETRSGAFTPSIRGWEHELRVGLPQGPPLSFRSRCGTMTPERTWIERFDLPAERARGLNASDDHLCVGRVDLPLDAGEWVGFVASLEDDASPYVREALRRRRAHDAGLLRVTKAQETCLIDAPPWVEQLVLAADGFLVERALRGGGPGVSVIAGYPWFADWGRDSFIALPGLTLATHRHAAARAILDAWAQWIDAGLMPNQFPEGGDMPEYNSADAPLWYIEAWRAYREATGDLPDLERRYATLTQIADHYAAGTRHGIAVDPSDGLLRAGDADTQITWMDARVDGRPVTPRAGKPVELNALWYNALMSLAELARLTGRSAEPYRGLAEQARAGFQRYLRPDGLGLYDVLDGPEGTDTRIRPNQILAVSLAHSPLAPADQAAVVRTVGARLLTSYGLRTLDPADPAYRAHYQGGVAERDSAYHQGPAWAWLLGHYALAVYRVSGDAASAQSLLEPIADHLADAGLGTVSELFDAEPPHTPRGAPSQAWSVAGTLMAWCQLARARPGAKEPSSE